MRPAPRKRLEYPGPWLPEPLAEPNQKSAELASSLTTAFLVLLEKLAPTERAVFLLREVFERDFAEIARSVGKSEANTRQILARARARLRTGPPRFNASRRESERVVRQFRDACATSNIEQLMAVLHADATLVSDGGGKVAAATRPVRGADRVAKFLLGYARKLHGSERNFQLVPVNGTPGASGSVLSRLHRHLANAVQIADVDRDWNVGRIAVVEEVIEPDTRG